MFQGDNENYMFFQTYEMKYFIAFWESSIFGISQNYF